MSHGAAAQRVCAGPRGHGRFRQARLQAPAATTAGAAAEVAATCSLLWRAAVPGSRGRAACQGRRPAPGLRISRCSRVSSTLACSLNSRGRLQPPAVACKVDNGGIAGWAAEAARAPGLFAGAKHGDHANAASPHVWPQAAAWRSLGARAAAEQITLTAIVVMARCAAGRRISGRVGAPWALL